MESQIQCAVSLRSFNTFGVEAQGRVLCGRSQRRSTARVLMDARVRDLPRLVLGGGSNVLFTKDFDGLVVKIDIPGYARAEKTMVVTWCTWVPARRGTHSRPAARRRAAGRREPRPDSRFGRRAPIQNIGAYGLELAERLHAVRGIRAGERIRSSSLDVDACRFGYRDSIFKQRRADGRIVVGVTLALPKHWAPVVGYADVENELKSARCLPSGGPRRVRRRRRDPQPEAARPAGRSATPAASSRIRSCRARSATNWSTASRRW